MIEVIPADTPRLVRQFVEFPYQLYAGDACWVPPLRRDERRRLDAHHNPFFEHATMTLWLARDGGQLVGRIASIVDRLADETHGERNTWFGFFEARHQEAAAALLNVVEREARKAGSSAVRGPVNPSLNESAGLLIDAFEQRPYVLMPYNPPSYASFIESAGYSKLRDLLAWTIDVTAPLGDRILRLSERVARNQKIVVRTADLRAFDRDVGIVQTIYRVGWRENWGFVPPTEGEIRQLAEDLRPIIDPELVLFAEVEGRPVACAVAIPDLNQVLVRMNGNLFPFGIVHFLRRRHYISQLRLLLLGVLPELRRAGLYPLLVDHMRRHALAAGYRRAELSWTLEDNEPINAGIEAAGGRRYKTYRLYERAVG